MWGDPDFSLEICNVSMHILKMFCVWTQNADFTEGEKVCEGGSKYTDLKQSKRPF